MSPRLGVLAVLLVVGSSALPVPAPQSSLLAISPHYQGFLTELYSGNHGNPEAMWPNGVFLPPDEEVQSIIHIHELGQTLADTEEDPLLLTGSQAVTVLNGLFGHGELFFDEVPHERALMRIQQERRVNGLDGHRLGSNRPESPFYRWDRRSRSHRRRNPIRL
ncbi:uncharacterized protein [Periplaneta americana]|uniref:uncharacterized protein n=1 Tax=Periplaneta americana TaxID=6978 RepID=UPI0037E9121A